MGIFIGIILNLETNLGRIVITESYPCSSCTGALAHCCPQLGADSVCSQPHSLPVRQSVGMNELRFLSVWSLPHPHGAQINLKVVLTGRVGFFKASGMPGPEEKDFSPPGRSPGLVIVLCLTLTGKTGRVPPAPCVSIGLVTLPSREKVRRVQVWGGGEGASASISNSGKAF